jgi:acyl-CoA reductase-like NAD-dependent aldehyde dehydrogenase
VPPRLLLELGGKDAAYVRADADVERAVRGCMRLPDRIEVHQC